MGRPSSYSDELAHDLCEWLADGGSMRGWCRQEGKPTFSTVYKWLEEREAFSDAYARARLHQAHNDADRMNELVDALASGQIASDVARVMMDGLKWTSARRNPRSYGDKVSLDAGQGGALTVTWLPPQEPSNS